MEHPTPSRPPSATLEAVATLASGDDPRLELAARMLTEHNEAIGAPSPDDLRAQLRMLTSERDEAARATARLIEGVGRAEAERDALRAQLAAAEAERDALRAIVEGRATPPTDAEVDALRADGGAFRYRTNVGAAGWVHTQHDLHLPPFVRGDRQTWWAHDAERRPCAWPTVPA